VPAPDLVGAAPQDSEAALTSRGEETILLAMVLWQLRGIIIIGP
jgi:hypothetical protein